MSGLAGGRGTPDTRQPAAAADVFRRQAAAADVLRRIRDEGVEQVRVAWCDLHGAWRSKTLVVGTDAAAVAEALHDGMAMVSTLLLKDSADRTAFRVFEPGGLDALADPGFGAANNLLLRPDPASFQRLPWAPHTGWLRADLHFDDGRPVAACPRRVLQQALAALQGLGYGLRCGLELEFHIHRIDPSALNGAPADQAAWPAELPPLRLLHPGYQLLGDAHADACAEALDIVRRTALGLALPLRSLEIEFGPSQFEAVFAPTDALQAADHLALFRNGVRQALRRAGYHASFCGRPPLPEHVASGWHLHQSLVDAAGASAMRPPAGASPALPAPGRAAQGEDARRWLSDAGAHWLAGLLQHAGAVAALCTPSVAGYARYRGALMAPSHAAWGRDDRSAMLRVLVGRDAGGGAAARIENRLPEAMANPYLAIAANVLAGLDGLSRRLLPPPAGAGFDGAPPAALPASLPQALDALRASPALQRGLGPALAAIYDTVKRQEAARYASAGDDASAQAAWQGREYLARF